MIFISILKWNEDEFFVIFRLKTAENVTTFLNEKKSILIETRACFDVIRIY